MSGDIGKLVPLRGNESSALKLVIVGDGYTAHELRDFARNADSVAQLILATPPFDELAPCIVRLDAASNQSTAYRSARGGNVDTRFGWRFDERDHHVLNVDQDELAATVRSALPDWGAHKILVVVNAPEILAGGGIFAPHCDPRVTGIAIASNANGCAALLHELGHAFGLGDEYADSPVMGDSPPNVASDPQQLPGFWRERITADRCPTPGKNRDVVGAFESSRRPRRYRPQYSCIMKSASALDRFCKVCADWIREMPAKTSVDRKAMQ